MERCVSVNHQFACLRMGESGPVSKEGKSGSIPKLTINATYLELPGYGISPGLLPHCHLLLLSLLRLFTFRRKNDFGSGSENVRNGDQHTEHPSNV